MFKALPLLAVGFGWLLLKGASAARAVQTLTTELLGARIHKLVGFTEVDARVTIGFINTTSAAVSFSGVVLNVFYKDKQIGTVVGPGATIAAAGRSKAEFPFSISLLSLGSALFSQLRSGGKLGAVRFVGHIQAAGVDIPVDQTIDLAGFAQ